MKKPRKHLRLGTGREKAKQKESDGWCSQVRQRRGIKEENRGLGRSVCFQVLDLDEIGSWCWNVSQLLKAFHLLDW